MNAFPEPRKIVRQSIGIFAVNQPLDLIIKGLLDSQLAMRNRVRLKGKRCRHTILVASEHVRQGGPMAGNLFVLDER